MVDGKKTPKDVLKEQGIEVGHGSVHLDGSTLTAQQMNTSLAELTNNATTADLIVVVKADSAM